MSREIGENGFVEGFPISGEGATADTDVTYQTLQPMANISEVFWSQASQDFSILTYDGPMNQTETSIDSVAESIQETPLADIQDPLEMDDFTLRYILGISCENNKLAGDNPSFARIPTDDVSVRSNIIDEDSDSLLSSHESVLMHGTNIPLGGGASLLSPEGVVPFVAPMDEGSPLAVGETETRGRRRSAAACGRVRQTRSSSVSSVSSTSSSQANPTSPGVPNANKPKQRRRPLVPKVYARTEPFEDAELEKKRLNAISAKKNRDLKKQQSAAMKQKLENAERERDALMRELREMKHREETLRTELEKKGVAFPCL